MTRTLANVISIKQRFGRSVNVERDESSLSIEGYIPTARALDVIGRMVFGIENPSNGRAISITGPYGSGKSSLALFLTALFGPACTVRNAADELLAACDSGLSRRLGKARSCANKKGFILCVVVAQREPVTTTIIRALCMGVTRYSGNEVKALKVPAFSAVLDSTGVVTASSARLLLEGVASVAPVLMVLDEFGKNLEQFVAFGGAEDDLFVLQEIAEWTTSTNGNPIILLTLQHLAFEDYAAGASTVKRREWSKVQGRFADIPYIESPSQTQSLIPSVFELNLDVSDWATEEDCAAYEAGFSDLLHVKTELMYPLHPATVAVLPELCSRYGQNERTLFSFLAGPDPFAVPAFLSEHSYDVKMLLPSVRLDRVYDFFLESASTMVTASVSASRWLEIETRLRDTVGLTPDELRVLKIVAVLNLVAAGGVLRASKSMISAVVIDKSLGITKPKNVEKMLNALEIRGIITYREFADEYRIWNGSDYDLKGAVELARRRLAEEPPASILERVRPQAPVVAARHSQRTGTFRVFERHFVDATGEVRLNLGQTYDGAVLLCVEPIKDLKHIEEVANNLPVVIGMLPSTTNLVDAAREFAAHLDILDGKGGSISDWVAKQELRERAASAAASLDIAIEQVFGGRAGGISWNVLGKEKKIVKYHKSQPLSSFLSNLCDNRYVHAPIVKNEMLSRRNLTSQGAMARRELLEAMVTSPNKNRCGITGYGPQRAMFEAILARPGIHRERDGVIGFGAPIDKLHSSSDLQYGPIWKAIENIFFKAEGKSISLDQIYRRLMSPPIGLKEGPIPVLLTAALLANSETISLYENGSFVVRLDPPLLERLIRNPALFSIKNYMALGFRSEIVPMLGKMLAELLGIEPRSSKGIRNSSIVGVVGPLLGFARSLPAYTQNTKQLEEKALTVRTALFTTTEPDGLLFEGLPMALGVSPFVSKKSSNRKEIRVFTEKLKTALSVLGSCFDVLLNHIEEKIRESLAVRGDDIRRTIAGRMSQFSDAILDPEVKSFVLALADDTLDRTGWLEYLGMVLTSKAPRSWNDDDVRRFEIRLGELAAAVRRIEGLYYERSAVPRAGFDPVRVGFTTPDGRDTSRVVWIDTEVHDDLNVLVTEILSRVGTLLGPDGGEMLLAKLAIEVLGDSIPQRKYEILDGKLVKRASSDD